MSARRIDKTLGLGVLALAILLALLLLVIGSAPEAVDGSVGSNADSGRRALFLLVQELGLTPESWNQPPGRLPRGENLVWLARAPERWSEQASKQKSPHLPGQRTDDDGDKHSKPEDAPQSEHAESGVETQSEGNTRTTETLVDHKTDIEVPAALRMHALPNYRRFVEEGGTLVVRYDERGQQFLRDDLALDSVCDLELDKDAPAGVRRLRTESGEELDVEWPKGAAFRELTPNGSARALWTAARAAGQRDETLAVVVPIGSGRLVLLGSDAFLDNASLSKHDHALLAVRLAEHLPPGGRMLFDEFALGLWQPQTVSRLATSPALFLITAHLVLLAALLLWSKAWVSTFPRDPPALARVSPLSRARARAALCERAGRYDSLAGMLRRGSVRRWLATARLRRSKTDEPERQAADLAALVAQVGPEPERDRRREAVVQRHVNNAAELEALARDLDAIGAEIELEERRMTLRAG